MNDGHNAQQKSYIILVPGVHHRRESLFPPPPPAYGEIYPEQEAPNSGQNNQQQRGKQLFL